MLRKKDKKERVNKSLNIGIVGLGLIGASLAMSLKSDPSVNIIGCDCDRATVDKAFERDIIHLGGDDPRILRGCAVIFVAVDVGSAIGVISEVFAAVGDTAIITDVASVKGAIMQSVPRGARFVGGHPMTGSEKSGIDAATRDLFAGCKYVLTRAQDTTESDFELVATLVARLGAEVLELDADTHDRAAAAISHLPHALAYTLIEAADLDSAAGQMAAGSFRDMTRIAASDARFWSDVARLNSAQLADSIADFRARLERLENSIRQGDAAVVEQAFAAAQAKKQRFSSQKQHDNQKQVKKPKRGQEQK